MSISAINTLNKNPLTSRIPNLLQSIAPAKQSNNKTVAVSVSWETKVEPLFLNHRCFPFVILFQKWKILISINWANKYASIDAATAIPVNPNTLENVSLFIGDQLVASDAFATNIIRRTKILAHNPDKTTWFAFFLP